MAIVVTLEVPDMTEAQYEKSVKQFSDAVKHAQGFIAHSSGASETGYFVTEIWASQEDWERWMREAIMPSAQDLGIQPSPPTIRQAETVITAA
jgi:heme-degrading monooxygenase HmoA